MSKVVPHSPQELDPWTTACWNLTDVDEVIADLLLMLMHSLIRPFSKIFMMMYATSSCSTPKHPLWFSEFPWHSDEWKRKSDPDHSPGILHDALIHPKCYLFSTATWQTLIADQLWMKTLVVFANYWSLGSSLLLGNELLGPSESFINSWVIISTEY